jgi:hypothetical protein
MESASTVEFAQVARAIARTVRRQGLIAPSYRCPPRLVGADRSIRRRPEGAVVSVRVRNRPLVGVVADMIEGVVVANELRPPRSDRVRAELWEVIGSSATGQHVDAA